MHVEKPPSVENRRVSLSKTSGFKPSVGCELNLPIVNNAIVNVGLLLVLEPRYRWRSSVLKINLPMRISDILGVEDSMVSITKF